MFSILIIAEKSQPISELRSGLVKKGFNCSIVASRDKALNQIAVHAPDIVLLEIKDNPANSRAWELSSKIKGVRNFPLIALVSQEMLDSHDMNLKITDDFAVRPYDANELTVRIKRLLQRVADTSEIINCGDLVIDLAKCEVSISDKLAELTFKEYELLRFLASNRDRVFTRDTLLNKVWGYDYYGGDRTVDVHIRRLRSKIEDSNHTFIETVRNIGYRFKCA